MIAALRLARLQARALARDLHGVAGAAGFFALLAGSVVLRTGAGDALGPPVTTLCAISGPLLGRFVATGARVPRLAGGPPMPALPVGPRERSLAALLLGLTGLAVSLVAGALLAGDAATSPALPHAAQMALLLTPGLWFGPRTGNQGGMGAGAIAAWGLAILAGPPGLLGTLPGAAAYAAIALALQGLPTPELPRPRWSRRVGHLGRPGSSPRAALFALLLPGAALYGATIGPLLAIVPFALERIGAIPPDATPVAICVFAASALPPWPPGLPNPIAGQAAALARLPVRRGEAFAAGLLAWLAAALAIGAGFGLTAGLLGVPLELRGPTTEMAFYTFFAAIGLLYRTAIAWPLWARRAGV